VSRQKARATNPSRVPGFLFLTFAFLLLPFALSAAPANDNFANAAVLSGALPITRTDSNAGATAESGEPNHAGNAATASVWYAWQATANMGCAISTAGSGIDTSLSVYTGSSLSSLITVAEQDDNNLGPVGTHITGMNPFYSTIRYASPTVTTTASRVQFWAVAGTTYYIAVDGSNGATGNISLTISAASVVSVVAATATVPKSGAQNGTFTISRTGDASAALALNISFGGTAVNGVDYQNTTANGRVSILVSIAANATSTTVSFKPLNDGISTGPKTVTLKVGTDPNYLVDPAGDRATVTITDTNPPVAGQVSDISFSPERGFYTFSAQAPLRVSITTPTPGATIRVTTDGSLPTAANGTTYTGPIPVTATMVLRAMAYRVATGQVTALAPTRVHTHTYICISDVVTQTTATATNRGFPPPPTIPPVSSKVTYGLDATVVNRHQADLPGDLTSLPTVSVAVALPDLFDANTGIFANPRQFGTDWERPVSVELLDPNLGQQFQSDAGARVRGSIVGTDPSDPKRSLSIDYGDYGDAKLKYRMFGPHPAPPAFMRFDLRAGANFSWNCNFYSRSSDYVKDSFSRETQRALCGLGTRGDFYHLYINGIYWGVYNSEERNDSAFQAYYLGGNKNDYDIVKADWLQVPDERQIVAQNGTLDAWSRLWKRSSADLTGNAAYFRLQGRNPNGTPNPALENLLDVDNLIDFMLTAFYTGNSDGPSTVYTGETQPNNFYATRNRTRNEGFRFWNHDNEQTLWLFTGDGDIKTPSLNWDRTLSYNDSSLVHSDPRWFMQKCEANPEFRLRVADHIQKHFFNGGALTPAACAARYKLLTDRIFAGIVGESARWGNTNRTPAYERDTDWVTVRDNTFNAYISATPLTRTDIVLGQLRNRNLFPSLNAPVFDQYGANFTATVTLHITNPNATGQIYYTTDGTDPRVVGGAVAATAQDGGMSVPVTWPPRPRSPRGFWTARPGAPPNGACSTVRRTSAP
jgi:hypothetical protein